MSQNSVAVKGSEVAQQPAIHLSPLPDGAELATSVTVGILIVAAACQRFMAWWKSNTRQERAADTVSDAYTALVKSLQEDKATLAAALMLANTRADDFAHQRNEMLRELAPLQSRLAVLEKSASERDEEIVKLKEKAERFDVAVDHIDDLNDYIEYQVLVFEFLVANSVGLPANFPTISRPPKYPENLHHISRKDSEHENGR